MLYRTLVIATLLKRILLQIKHVFAPNKEELQKLRASKFNALIKLRITTAIQAIKMLKNELTPENKAISYQVIGEYNKIITKYKLAKKLKDPGDFAKLERDLRQKAFQAERDEIQNLYEKGEITRDITQKIRQQINIREAYSMEDK
jgi:CPA1 family monovalent cation:H+ antiporter